MSLTPVYPVKSNRVIELQKGNPFEWAYRPFRALPEGSIGYLTFKNLAEQVLDVWESDDQIEGALRFFAEEDRTDVIPRNASWTLTIDLGDGSSPRLFEQGIVTRVEAFFAEGPDSGVWSGSYYQYPFSTPGVLLDPSWEIRAGAPRIYDNSGSDLPNALGAGSPSYDQSALMWFAPLKGDTAKVTYSLVRGVGEIWVLVCTNYDLSNSAGVYHKQQASGNDTIGIATGNGAFSYTNKATATHSRVNPQNFTAIYNPNSNTFSAYIGDDLATPAVSWPDSSGVVHHGLGERYLAVILKPSSGAGVQIGNWVASDSV